MSIKDIITVPDEMLKKISEPIEKIGTNEKKLIKDLFDTMYASNGIGLAAVQIGVLKRILVIDVSAKDEPKKPLSLINPIIKKLSVRVIDEIRANLLFKTKQHIQSEFHVDKDYFCNTAIFYINKNNGYTLLKDKTKIKVEENKLLIIDTKTYHAAVTATDTDRRIVINFNYS